MSKIRLNGTSSGYTELAPPAAAGSNTITLPSSNGSANQFLKNGSTAGTLGWSSMVEDSSGNINIDSGTLYVDAGNNRVGIGTTSPSVPLEVNGSIYSKLSTSGEAAIAAVNSIASFFVLQQSDKAHFYTGASQPIAFTTSNTERARITSGGEVLINTTTSYALTTIAHAGATAFGLAVRNTDTGSASQIAIRFMRNTSDVGSITNTNTATAYNTSSDYRLKENVVPLTGATERLAQLPVHRFNFIADPGHTVDGFLAHEAQAVVPECVTGEKDAVDADGNPIYQGIDQSKLVPLLTAALQEALDKIASLEARITALEAA